MPKKLTAAEQKARDERLWRRIPADVRRLCAAEAASEDAKRWADADRDDASLEDARRRISTAFSTR